MKKLVFLIFSVLLLSCDRHEQTDLSLQKRVPSSLPFDVDNLNDAIRSNNGGVVTYNGSTAVLYDDVLYIYDNTSTLKRAVDISGLQATNEQISPTTFLVTNSHKSEETFTLIDVTNSNGNFYFDVMLKDGRVLSDFVASQPPVQAQANACPSCWRAIGEAIISVVVEKIIESINEGNSATECERLAQICADAGGLPSTTTSDTWYGGYRCSVTCNPKPTRR